jgi:hypothetical protein
METYILFLYGMFDDMEDIEFYCNEVLLQNSAVHRLKFIVENNRNLVIILQTKQGHDEFSKSLHKDLTMDNVKFYFMFRRDEMISAHLPQEVKDFIFGNVEDRYLSVQYSRPKKVVSLDVDEILEKIKKEGIDSLTVEEKKFLDDFEN